LIFTSGTSDAPKAVICTQRRIMVTGVRMSITMNLTPDDVGYVAMPLFHSNAVMVGWAPSIVVGASVGLARRFTASGWLSDIRSYGATWFNYTGKPLSYVLATPEMPDDADNPLRVAFGNEGSPQVVAAFARRFGVEVIDAFGATEGGVAVNRTDDMPTGAMGLVGDNVKVVDEEGHARQRARFEGDGRLLNADECVGEIVNTSGVGPFEGYYNNPEANERTTRFGWYWSGDLGYVDDAGYLYFAGRNAEWLRVDGENFPAGPIEAAVARHPDVVIAAVYGVPDEQAGDQVMAALILRDGASFDPAAFATWIEEQADLGPKWRPRYVRVSSALPSTATNKVLKRTLIHEKFRSDRVSGDPVWVRGRGEDSYRPFTSDDEGALQLKFGAAGRDRFWDL
jgi:fatty-acyl-CoA synthase